MRKFLRCKACGRLLSPEGKWVQDSVEAWQFDSMEQAREAIKAFHLPTVDLYYSFEDEFHSNRWDFEVAFSEAAEKGKREEQVQPVRPERTPR